LQKKFTKFLKGGEIMAELNFGDVIYVDRGLYKHFGIYSGNKQVIHYVKDSGEFLKGKISETSLARFLDGDSTCYICNFDSRGKRISESRADLPIFSAAAPRISFFDGLRVMKILYDFITAKKGKLFSPKETVNRARSCIGMGEYNLIFHNCEHFAVWCKTGIEKSEQIDEMIDMLIEIARPMKV